jgi:hypothetical protein
MSANMAHLYAKLAAGKNDSVKQGLARPSNHVHHAHHDGLLNAAMRSAGARFFP